MGDLALPIVLAVKDEATAFWCFVVRSICQTQLLKENDLILRKFGLLLVIRSSQFALGQGFVPAAA